VFADSLPDGWGRLLVDRILLKNKINPATLSAIDRLAIVGASGMGALTYEPDYHFETPASKLDLDKLSNECAAIFASDYSENLDELFRLGGSSGGARPKILTEIDGEDWIIKFPAREDGSDIGVQEYEYSLCARRCGIEMPETKLFPSKTCGGYFGVKRFDRKKDMQGCVQRIHMNRQQGFWKHLIGYRILIMTY
jgi:serine/threonine-protein kinase HipA